MLRLVGQSHVPPVTKDDGARVDVIPAAERDLALDRGGSWHGSLDLVYSF